MKITKILMLLAVFFAFSCSKDDDSEPAQQNLEDVEFGFAKQSSIVNVPPAMASSQNTMAQTANAFIGMANGIASYTSYMEAPQGATRSTTRITDGSGRIQASGNVVNYVWSDPNSGTSVAYQVSEESNSYVFEVFMKYDASEPWAKFIEIEERKDKSAGSMAVYSGMSGSNEVIYSFEWIKNGDNLLMTIDSDASHVELNVNTKTGAGSMVTKYDDVKQYEMSWDAQGAGTYTSYDEQGNFLDEGTW